jgi:hypothetical protein
MSKQKKVPEGLPPIPADADPVSVPEVTEPEMTVEAEAYQLEQETDSIEALPPICPRCGSTERTRLKEISPRLETDRGTVIRYRTQCTGQINPVDKDGKPVVDEEGKPVSYQCGNRYKVKKFVPKRQKAAS